MKVVAEIIGTQLDTGKHSVKAVFLKDEKIEELYKWAKRQGYTTYKIVISPDSRHEVNES